MATASTPMVSYLACELGEENFGADAFNCQIQEFVFGKLEDVAVGQMHYWSKAAELVSFMQHVQSFFGFVALLAVHACIGVSVRFWAWLVFLLSVCSVWVCC